MDICHCTVPTADQKYRNTVLKPYERIFRGIHGSHLLLMDDNSRPHDSNHSNQYIINIVIREVKLYNLILNMLEFQRTLS